MVRYLLDKQVRILPLKVLDGILDRQQAVGEGKVCSK